MTFKERIILDEGKLISNKSFIFNIALFLGYVVLSFVTFAVVKDFLHIFLIWNLLLAAIPYAIAFLLDRKFIKTKVGVVLVLLVWLFFFPNSVYIITDLIYVNSVNFITQINSYDPITYIQNLSAYMSLFHIYLGSIIGLIYGYKSLSVIYDLAKDTVLKKYRDLLCIIVFILTGVGIYIGRFFRYNSWDIFRVFNIIKDFFSSLSWFTLFFVLMLTVLQIIIYYGFKINFIRKEPTQ